MSNDDIKHLSREDLIAEVQRLREAEQSNMRLQQLVHELEVYQEETRIQNEQLTEAQHALEQSRDRYADLYDYAPIAYVTLDRHGIVLDINLTGSSLLATERTRIIGLPLMVFVTKDQRQAFLDHLARCRKGATTAVITALDIQNRSGDVIPVQLVSRPLDPSSTTFRTTITDLTEQKRGEAERQRLELERRSAEAASKAKDQFLAVLSHELRTPLTPVLAAISALREGDLASPMRSMVEMIYRNIALEARLIDDLLDLTRIGRGKLRLNPQPIDAHEVVSDVVAICSPEAKLAGCSIEVEASAMEHYVNADPTRLRQVVWNLLRNAIKFSPGGGPISVRTGSAGGRLYMQVTDQGIGMDEEALQKIFRPFVQAAPTEHRGGGLGLGL
ncbi:MAG TPA: PAS domain-containing sensor histidine kinase, partial [Tepidisphaeraceae bacterium]